MVALLVYLVFPFFLTGSAERSHWGTEFVIPFLSNFEKSGTVYIYMMTKEPALVYVEIPWKERYEYLTIPSNSRGSVALPWDIRYEEDMTVVPKAVYINSTNELAVYSLSYVSNSASSYLAIPVELLGDRYIAVSYFRSTHDTSVIVAAAEDDTEVTFHYNVNGGSCGPSAYTSGQTSTHMINRLDVIGTKCTKDLTGTVITSNRPVSVVSGNVGGKVPVSKGGKDVFEEMMIPVKDLGREYVITNVGRSVGSISRIVATEDNTEVTSSSGNVYNLTMFEYIDIETEIDGEQCIVSNKPVMAVAFGKGVKGNSDSLGDPLMSVIPPVDRFYYDYFIEFDLNNNVSGFLGSEYLTIVVASADIPYMEDVMSASTTVLVNCDYGVIHKEVTTWPIQLQTPNTTRFSATLYGVSSKFMGLGMPLGMTFVPQYCWSSTCENNGTCEEINETFVCNCEVGFTGDRCQYALEATEATEATEANSTPMEQMSTTEIRATRSSETFWRVKQTEDTVIAHSPITTHNEVLSSGFIYTLDVNSLIHRVIPTPDLPTYTYPVRTGSTLDTMDTVSKLSVFTALDYSEILDYITATHMVLHTNMLTISVPDSQLTSVKIDTSPIFDTKAKLNISGIVPSLFASVIKATRSVDVILNSLSNKAASLRSARLIVEVCTCLCKGSRLEYLEVSAVKEVTDKIHAELLLDTKSLSKTIRRYTSAPDDRTSAQNVGALGIALLAFTFGVMIISDILTIFRAVFRYFKKK